MPTLFEHYPIRPDTEQCFFAFTILCNAHDASSSFLDIFRNSRAARNARGAATDIEQDLLRAMLSFASAGLDSMVKQLIKDALPNVIDSNVGAFESFRSYTEKRIVRNEEFDHKLIADLLCDVSPRQKLVETLVNDLTSSSLQSAEAIFRAGSFFNIPSIEICADPNELKRVFQSRNQIIHEMDVDFGQPNRNRRQRRMQRTIDSTNIIFLSARNFLAKVSERLQ